MNKKIAIVSIIILVIVLVGGFFIYQYAITLPSSNMENINGGSTIQASPQHNNDTNLPGAGGQIQSGGIGAKGTNGGGTLTVCLDKCGDGVCQSEVSKCKPDDLNCICKESKADCPQDCK